MIEKYYDKLTPEQRFEEQASTMDRDQLYDLAKRQAVEIERVKAEHCKDCCCARSWEALGNPSYSGTSIPQHIEQLQRELAEARGREHKMVRGFETLLDEWESESFRQMCPKCKLLACEHLSGIRQAARKD